jgi:hypothetical protein
MMSSQQNDVRLDTAALGATSLEIQQRADDLQDHATAIGKQVDTIKTQGVDAGALEAEFKRLLDTKNALVVAAKSLERLSRSVERFFGAEEAAPNGPVPTEPDGTPEVETDAEVRRQNEAGTEPSHERNAGGADANGKKSAARVMTEPLFSAHRDEDGKHGG